MHAHPQVLAMAAHPDDIEFMMSGTLMMLGKKGWGLHYMNVANGSCGTVVERPHAIVQKRREEALEACGIIGARYHEGLCNDLEIFYTFGMVARALAVVRRVMPRIILAPSPQDYMEDHQNACRIAVTAAFCRGMANYASDPPVAPVMHDVTVYHAMPHGLRDPMRKLIRPGQYVDVTSVIDDKRKMLACHRSQKEWLDQSQGLDAYLDTMEGFGKEVGSLSGCFAFAEGWRRRSHLGMAGRDSDPLSEALGNACAVDRDYEKSLEEP